MKTVSTSFTITTVISLMMCCTVPAGPPRQFFGFADNSTSITVSWSAPATPNGVITEYQLQCSGGGQVFSRTVMGSQTTTTLSGLLPYTNYSCNITAHTSVGGGPAATTSVTTKQDGEPILCKCLALLGSTVVSPYVGMARKQNGGYNASISVQTLIFHLVVNSTRLKTVRSALWRCPNSTVALRLLENVVKVTNLEVVKIVFRHLPFLILLLILLLLLQPA